nr:60S ribosomal protein L18 [Cryptomonas sp.]
MGIFRTKHNGKGNFNRSSTQSKNVYLGMLMKIYRFLSRRTNSKFNCAILKRLQMSRTNRPSISLSRLIRLSNKNISKTIVIVGKVLNDDRVIFIPKISVCALKVSKTTKKRIIAAGGNVLTFDQLAVTSPSGRNTILIRGPKHQRKVYRFFEGVAGANVRRFN